MGKYSREELLQIGRALRSPEVDVDLLVMPGFSPAGHVNGHTSRGWGKTNDANAHNDPTICWNAEGSWGPLGLQELSTEEKEVGAPELLCTYAYAALCCRLDYTSIPRSCTHPSIFWYR